MRDADRKHLYLVDGTSQLFRAYFAIRGLTDPEGRPTSAVYGFTTMLRKMIADEAPPYLAVAFDLEGPTFRHERFADYKAHRPPVPADLIEQMPRAREVCRALRIPVLELPGYEADDLIATCATRAAEAGFRTTIVAGDKDLLQLVGPEIDVWNPSKNLRLDASGVVATFGVAPERVRDVLGLMGDAVDNIPGVPGVGEKTALAMVATYGGLESVLTRAERFVRLLDARDSALLVLERGAPDEIASSLAELDERLHDLSGVESDSAYRARIDEVASLTAAFAGPHPAPVPVAAERRKLVKALKELEKGSARKTWAATHAHADDARLSRELATLDARVPFVFDSESLRRTTPDVVLAREVFRALGFRSFLAEVSESELAPAAPRAPLNLRSEAAEVLADPGALERFAERARLAGAFAVGLAVEGSHPLRTRLIGMGLAASSGETVKVIWSETLEGAVDAAARRALAALLADPTAAKVVHDQKQALHAFRNAGIRAGGFRLDTKVGAFLLDPGRGRYALAEVAADVLEEEAQPSVEKAARQGGLFSPGALEAKVDEAVTAAWTCARVAPAIELRLAREGLADLYENVDGPLLPILVEMEAHGIRVDRGVLEAMSREMEAKLTESRQRIVVLAGEPLNPDSPKQLREVLFGKLGLKPLRKTAKSKVESTDAETLEDLAVDHEIARQILAYRELAKLKGTYVDALPVLIAAETGRVHTTYEPTGAATGRLSSSDPNLQNIPVRSEAGRRIRAAFVPEPGFVFLASDYSQVELRILAHLCADPELTAAFRAGEDIHRRTAARIFGIAPELVTDEMRRRAKAVNFGILYGMSESRLAREQGFPRAEAHRFIEAYFERFQRVRAYIDGVREQVLRDGEVRTLFGRVRKFPQLRERSGRAAIEQALRAAVNTTVQGTAADLMKMAMIAVDKSVRGEGLSAKMLLQVHDELLFEVPESELERTAKLVRSAMEGVWPLSVPLVVDQKVGRTWLEAT